MDIISSKPWLNQILNIFTANSKESCQNINLLGTGDEEHLSIILATSLQNWLFLFANWNENKTQIEKEK